MSFRYTEAFPQSWFFLRLYLIDPIRAIEILRDLGRKMMSALMETIQSYVTLIKDIITVLATATAGALAVKGFQTWKQELHWKTEYELAHRLAKATYKVRDAIARFRNPLPIGTEVQRIMNATLENRKIYKSQIYASAIEQVYRKQWKAIQESLLELDTVSLEVEAIWGETALDQIDPLKKCTTLLSTYMEMHIRNVSKPDSASTQNAQGAIEEILYESTGNISNKFSNQITEAVRKIENFLKPYLKI
jgi:hypothetical protein